MAPACGLSTDCCRFSSILLGKLQGRVVLGLPHLGPVLLAKAPAPCLTCATLMCSIL